MPRKPSVVRVRKGVSANVFVNNKAFRDHLKSKFDATPTNMESAAVALVCYQHKLPFIAFRAGSAQLLTKSIIIIPKLGIPESFWKDK
jgi:nucleoside phosphorylase